SSRSATIRARADNPGGAAKTLCPPVRRAIISPMSEAVNDQGEKSIVRLPSQVRGRFEVYINGVPQREGVDYMVRGRELRFSRRLAKDKISKWRWFVG